MSQAFDPYQQWLGIPLAEQPPNHYRLLGLPLREADPARIAQAAEQRMQIVRALAAPEQADLAGVILGKIAAARTTLLNPALKQHYDSLLPPEKSPGPSLPAIQLQPAGGAPAARSREGRNERKSARKRSVLPLLLLAAIAGAAVVVALAVVLRPKDESPPPRSAVDSADNGSVGPGDAPPSRDEPAIRQPSRRPAHRAIQGPQTMADLMAADTPADNGSLSSALATARQAMAGRNLDAARHHLESVADAVRSPTERAEYDRAMRLLELLDDFWSAVRRSTQRLQAGDEIQLEAGPAIVVDVSEEELIVRSLGRNRRYGVNDLPRPILVALARQGLGTGGPRSNLVIGAFHAADARGDRAEARSLLQDAGDEGRTLLAELDLMPAGGQPDAAELPAGASAPSSAAMVPSAADATPSSAPSPPPAPARRAVPDLASQAGAEDRIRQTYAEEFRASRGDASRSDLVERLKELAAESDADPAVQYAALQLACELAAKAGNPPQSLAVIDELDGRFAIDALERKSALLEDAWRDPAAAAHRAFILQESQNLLDRALAEKDYRSARRLVKVALAGAMASKDFRLARELEAKQRAIEAQP